MIRGILLFLFFSQAFIPDAVSQKLRKGDKEILADLQTDIVFLSDAKLEGRRSGTAGEKLAYDYIITSFRQAGLRPMGDSDSYSQKFGIYDGRDISRTTCKINDARLVLTKEFIPLPFSASGKVSGDPAIALQENGLPWFFDLKETIELSQTNPHIDLGKILREKTRDFAAKGASAIIFYNSSTIDDGISFDPAEGVVAEKIPAIYITNAGRQKYLKDISQSLEIEINVKMEEKKRWAHNIVGFMDNGALYTVVIGAHYDHLGFGEDGNSLYHDTGRVVHPGADDNASGTAGMMELSRLLKKTKGLRANYLFVAFSGEESGLIGSKYFTEHPPVPLSKISYMVNLDMIGRLNDSSKMLTIGGYGTSPQWAGVIKATVDKKIFVLNIDSSGAGPSDHTSFYLKNIPVLFFFTGIHRDYHKPTDQASKINYMGEMQILRLVYAITQKMDGMNKPPFAKTADKQFGITPAFSVTLGIMPDYSFSGSGVRVDAVTAGRPAAGAGLLAGDVITGLGNYSVVSLPSYMDALSKFSKGDQTTVIFVRGKEEMKANVQFK